MDSLISNPGMWLIGIAAILYVVSMFQEDSTFLNGVHTGRLIIFVTGVVLVLVFLLHTFNEGFRASFNSAFLGWWSGVPFFNVLIFLVLVGLFLFWAVKVVKRP